MNIEALRVFCEVARQQSFSRAATAAQITQSAASQAIQQMEKELDQQLIDRSHRPPQLTPAGEMFYNACREILDKLDRTITQMRELEGEVVGAVTVASIYSIGLYHADEFRRYMAAYPKASFRLQFLRPNLVVDAVLQGHATLGLTSYPRETRELSITPWKEEDMVLVCPTTHRLATAKKVSLEDLNGEDFVAFDSDLTIRKHIDAALHQHKVTVRVTFEFDNIETAKQAVQIGAGISILPEATVQHAAQAGSLAVVRFEPSELVRPVGIIHRKGKPLSLAAIKFIEMLTGHGPEMGNDSQAAESSKRSPRSNSKKRP